MKLGINSLRTVAMIAIAPLLAGCATAVGAAAGAAGAIAYDQRNASAEVAAPLETVISATEATFADMAITENRREVEDPGRAVEIHANSAEGDVSVDIAGDAGPTTRIVVTVREGQIEYKPGYAGEILEQILARAS